MTPEEIKAHLRTVALQEKVLRAVSSAPADRCLIVVDMPSGDVRTHIGPRWKAVEDEEREPLRGDL